MTRKKIGGPLDYSLMADWDKPSDEEVRREALKLISEHGLSVDDVGRALRIDPAQVAQWAAERECGQ